ncbi:LicD family protein [Chryseobacterium sp. JK1]|uniref:LicD family protein n=1 Tax=Chryseobacterium sp. JK1 TaxID=874294 RepID=UPI003D69D8CE
MNKDNYSIDDIREYSSSNIEQVHSVLLRMLRIFDAICQNNKINYWMDYGTLLGAVRHSGFIPWDFEADIGMLRSDFIRLRQIIETELPHDLFFQCEETDPSYIYGNAVEAKIRDRYSNYLHNEQPSETKNWHNGIQIDIFVYDRDLIFENCLTNAFERHMSNSNIHLQFDEIQYTTDCEFNGFKFPIPIGFDTYLRRNYDDYMKLPPPEHQIAPYVDVFNSSNHPAGLIWKTKL